MSIRYILIAAAMLMRFTGVSSAQSATPETVLVTYHAKSGSEAALANAIAKQWTVATSLKLVLDQPHVLVRGNEDGKPYFVEVFTWRDAKIPDSAPAAIQTIWSQMNQLVESRGGKPGIDFTAVSIETW